MSTSWNHIFPKPGGTNGEMETRLGMTQAVIDDLKDLDWVVDGVSLMKATIAHLEQRRKETAIQGGRFTNDQGKHTYVKFKWEGGDLLIDNTNVCHCGNKTPSIVIYTKSALKMGWLRKIDSDLVLGPNLQQEFIGDQIPNMTKDSGWNDVNDENLKSVFWVVRSLLPDYLQLSMSCSWRFTNLNVAFRSVVGEPTRSLHVYSDVAGRSIVGNRVTDLLREIQYKREGRGTMYFEPLHIQHMALRNEVVEIIQIQVAETFGTGATWSSLAKATPLSRCTSKRHKKKRVTCKGTVSATMPKTRVRRRRRKRCQRGGLLPLAALIPALMAGGKAAALGAVGGAASYGAKKAVEAATRKKRR